MNNTVSLPFYTGLIFICLLILPGCSSKVKEKSPVIASNTASSNLLRLIGSTNFATGYRFENTEVGGLSGIDYDKHSKQFYAISDDRGSTNFPRFYTLDIDIADGELSDGDVVFTAVSEILNPSNTRYRAGDLDPEAIRYNAKNQRLYWANEGDRDRWMAPTLRSMNKAGEFIDELPVPSSYTPKQEQGIRDNKSLESLALSVDGKYLYIATETALVQDGPAETTKQGSHSRVAKIDLASKQILGEYIYVTEAIAKKPLIPGLFATNGLVELLAVTENSFIAIERSFTLGKGTTIRLFLTSTQGATNLKGEFSIAQRATPPTPMPKKLLLNLDSLQISLDNIEAISFGPTLPNGDSTLVLVSDNNFTVSQSTLFLAFRFKLNDLPPLSWLRTPNT